MNCSNSRKPSNATILNFLSLINKIRQSTIGHINLSYITRVLTNVIAKMSQHKQSAIFACFDEKISMVYIQRQRRIRYIIIPKPNSSFFIPLKLLYFQTRCGSCLWDHVAFVKIRYHTAPTKHTFHISHVRRSYYNNIS